MYARFGFLGAFVLAAALAACGGGGSSPPTPVATPTPTIPPVTPAPPTQTVTLLSSAQSIPLPNAAGTSYAGTISVPAGSGTIVFAASTSPPGNAPVLDVAHWRKATSAVRATATAAPPYTTAAYITLTASTAVTLSGNVTMTVAPSSTYSIAQYNPQGYWITLATVNGAYVAQISPSNLAANATEYFAVYSGGTLPSPNPDGCVGAQPDLTTRGGTAQAQAVVVQPTSGTYMYTGTYSETISRATPCAMPTASSNATVAITVTTSPGPAGSPTAIYENSTETDTYATETLTTNTNALVGAALVGPEIGYIEFNETTTDEVNDSVVTTYASPPVLAVASPPNTTIFTNSPPSTVNATLADGTTSNRTYGSNGTYTENDTIAGVPSGSNQNVIVNNGSSGYYFVSTPNFAPSVSSIRFAYSAPANNVVTFTEYENGTATSSSDGTVVDSLAFPQWWSSSSFYSDTFTGGASSVSLPAECNAQGTGTFYPFTRATSGGRRRARLRRHAYRHVVRRAELRRFGNRRGTGLRYDQRCPADLLRLLPRHAVLAVRLAYRAAVTNRHDQRGVLVPERADRLRARARAEREPQRNSGDSPPVSWRMRRPSALGDRFSERNESRTSRATLPDIRWEV